MTDTADSQPILFATPDDWEAWLAEHHAAAKEVWIKLAKKGSGVASVSQVEAVEVALCYGWIDGRANPLDDDYWLQRFTPRKSKSKWSKVNRERVAKLIEAGRLQPAGLREVERAKADGRWEAAYDPPSQATVPDDLRQALEENEAARAAFEALNRTNRFAILNRIHDAKKPETRARRIEKFVAMLSEGKKLYP